MSSPDRRSFFGRAAAMVAVATLSVSLAGCLRPLYGPAAGGGTVQQALAGIVIEPVPDRIGHYLVEELRFDVDGSGIPGTPKYRLAIELTERIGSAIVSSETGRATTATITANVTYILKDYVSGKELLKGIAVGSASYDRSEQRFAAVRAARDAEIRVARTLADQIRTRLAADLAFRT